MRLGPPLTVLLLLAAVPALTQSEPQKPPIENPPAVAEDQGQVISPKVADPGERIVDPMKFPPKPSLASRIFMAPSHAIGPGLERQLTRVEQQRPIVRVQRIFSNPYAQPRVGSLGDGSGFGLGANFSSGDLISKDFRFIASAHVTSKRYFFGSVGVQADHRTGEIGWSLELIPRNQLRPQEDFWGTGPQSLRTDRTTYDLEERGVSLTLRASLRWCFSVTTQTLFGDIGLPSLSRGAELVGPFAFAEFEGRNVVGNPSKGAYLRPHRRGVRA